MEVNYTAIQENHYLCLIFFFNGFFLMLKKIYYIKLAALVGPKVLKDYLVNYARPLIYSTFTSFSNLASVKSAYQMLMAGETVKVID